MKKNQFLLLKLIEECSEIAHIASKQIQFGKDNVRRDQLKTNAQRLKEEILDLYAVIYLLHEELEIPVIQGYEEGIATREKIEKMQKYLNVSLSLRQLPEITL